jgi:hypothetical protein
MCNSFSKDCIQGASAAPFANALYSVSVDDQETLGCLRALQEMRLGPKKIQILLSTDDRQHCQPSQHQ